MKMKPANKNGSRSDEKHNSEIEPIWKMSFGFSKFRMMESKSIRNNDPKIDPKFNRKYEKMMSEMDPESTIWPENRSP